MDTHIQHPSYVHTRLLTADIWTDSPVFLVLNVSLTRDYTNLGFIQRQAMIWYPPPIAWPHPPGASLTLSRQRHYDVIRAGDASITWCILWISKGLTAGWMWHEEVLHQKKKKQNKTAKGLLSHWSRFFVLSYVSHKITARSLLVFLLSLLIYWALQSDTHLVVRSIHEPAAFRPDSKALLLGFVTWFSGWRLYHSSIVLTPRLWQCGAKSYLMGGQHTLLDFLFHVNRTSLLTGHSPLVQSFCGHWITGLVARAAPTLAHVHVCPKDFESQVLPPLVYLASLSINTTIAAGGGTTGRGSRGIS